MAQVNVSALNPANAEKRRQILQNIEDNLTDTELERLGKIAQSSKARSYLGTKFSILKGFLKL